MALMKWNPVNSLDVFRGFDDWFDNIMARPMRMWRSEDSAWSPRIDVVENEKSYELRAEIPGMNKKDININVKDDVLTISGEKKVEEKKEGENYYSLERRFGKFERSFRMADSVDAGKVSAAYKDGVLTVSVPKVALPEPKTTKIQIS